MKKSFITVRSMFCAAALIFGVVCSASAQNHTPTPEPTRGVMSDQVVVARLAQQGYDDIRNMRREGNNVIAEAVKEGRQVTVQIDGLTGQIHERQN
jgi:hypothetical protein